MEPSDSYLLRVLKKHLILEEGEERRLLASVDPEVDYFTREQLLYETVSASRSAEQNAKVADCLASELEAEVLDAIPDPDPAVIHAYTTEQQAERVRILPFANGKDGLVHVAVCYPWQEVHCDLLEKTHARRMLTHVATPLQWRMLNARAFESRGTDDPVDGVAASGNPIRDSVSGYIDWMLDQAVARSASDVHLEQTDNGGRIRFRMDGVLTDADHPPRELSLALASRMKLLAGMNLGEKRLPQDGSATFRVSGRNVDCRVSSIPSLHGECLAVRILMDNDEQRTLNDLGMDPGVRSIIDRVILRPEGLFVVCGPTGAGKSTTLYAILRAMDPERMKIITVEDPVESIVNGVNQVQINPLSGMTFASALRSILRQNPDMIMVGEIRDHETASIAVQAAFTGHAVFTSLHTRDALGAVIRLRDLGVESYLLSAAFKGAMSQRLVRKMIPEHRIAYTPPLELRKALGDPCKRTNQPGGDGLVFWKAGADNTAYKGRTGLYEAFIADDLFLRLVHAGESRKSMESHLIREGFVSMWQNAWNKIINGETSAEEILAVLGFSANDDCNTEPESNRFA